MGLPWRARRVAPTFPATSPFPPNLTADELVLQKMRAVCAQTNTSSIPRTLRLANSNFRQRQQWYSIPFSEIALPLARGRSTNVNVLAHAHVPGCHGLVGLRTGWLLLTPGVFWAMARSTRFLERHGGHERRSCGAERCRRRYFREKGQPGPCWEGASRSLELRVWGGVPSRHRVLPRGTLIEAV